MAKSFSTRDKLNNKLINKDSGTTFTQLYNHYRKHHVKSQPD